MTENNEWREIQPNITVKRTFWDKLFRRNKQPKIHCKVNNGKIEIRGVSHVRGK